MDEALKKISDKLMNHFNSQMNKTGMMFRLFSRVKTEKSICHKMEKKGDIYRSGKSKMQDIIGLRIVLYFQDDVDILSLYLSFNGVVKTSVDEPDSSTFCPQRLNLTRHIPEEFVEDFRKALPQEYAPYIDNTYEIQIRTVFSEGWHEVEHDLRYKCKDDWRGYEVYSRTLNGVIATLETAEWSMKSIFHEMSYKNYLNGNYRAMLRNKMRIRLNSDDFSSSVSAFLKSHPEVAREFMRIDRMVFILTVLNHKSMINLTYDTVLFLANRIEIKNAGLQSLESPAMGRSLNEFLAS